MTYLLALDQGTSSSRSIVFGLRSIISSCTCSRLRASLAPSIRAHKLDEEDIKNYIKD